MKGWIRGLIGTIVVLSVGCLRETKSSLHETTDNSSRCSSRNIPVDLCDPTATPTYEVTFRLTDAPLATSIPRKDRIILSGVATRMKDLALVDTQVAIAEKNILLNGKILDLDRVKNLGNPVTRTTESEPDCTECPAGGGGSGGGGEPEDNGDRLVLDALKAPKYKIIDPNVIEVSGRELIHPR